MTVGLASAAFSEVSAHNKDQPVTYRTKQRGLREDGERRLRDRALLEQKRRREGRDSEPRNLRKELIPVSGASTAVRSPQVPAPQTFIIAAVGIKAISI